LGEVLAEGPVLVESQAWLEGPAMDEAVWPLGPAVDVD